VTVRRWAWRPLRAADLPQVVALAAAVHVDLPEDDAVFGERLALAPATCRALDDGRAVIGYALAHPWRRGDCPPLNALVGALPEHQDGLHIHDVALLPEARGTGAGAEVATWLAAWAEAAGLPTLTLVAGETSHRYWLRHGFAVVAGHVPGVSSYGADARYMIRSTKG
jgi:GNAT superfamily N-acetyltransferase